MTTLGTAGDGRRLVIRELRRAASPRSQELSLVTAVAFVRVLDRCLVSLNRAAGLSAERELIVRETALQDGFPTFFNYLHSTVESTSDCILDTWTRKVRLLTQRQHSMLLESHSEPLAVPLSELSPERFHEYLTTFNVAVSEVLFDHSQEPKARLIIRELLQRLNLSYDDMGRLLNVSGETVRRWERGTFSVPPQKRALLERASASLGRLLRLIKPESLPSVIRRPAKLFDGESALDWIRSGKIDEVASRYETAFAYQG